ncbi:hypothetical protein NVP1185O_39 [Vibrio phage 1.185.O._10N.286.49.C2]|nr:hypothetical protein NVP1185O_39 [Vibrio phage 1.185.O._10N.286.49.C2]
MCTCKAEKHTIKLIQYVLSTGKSIDDVAHLLAESKGGVYWWRDKIIDLIDDNILIV